MGQADVLTAKLARRRARVGQVRRGHVWDLRSVRRHDPRRASRSPALVGAVRAMQRGALGCGGAEAVTDLTELPAWRALEAHHAVIAPRHLRDLFAEDPGRGERFVAEGAGLFMDYAKHRVDEETMRLLFALADALRPSLPLRCDVRRRARERLGGPPSIAHRAAAPARGLVGGRRGRRGAGGPCGARPDDRAGGSGALRGVDRPHRTARSQHREHRDRRLRSRARDGVPRAAPLRPPGPRVPFRLQRGRHGLHGGHHGPRPRRDPPHRLLQDVHDPRDDDERGAPRAAGSSMPWATRPRWPSTSWPCPPTPRRWPRSGSTRSTCSGSGTGWAVGTRWIPRSASPP